MKFAVPGRNHGIWVFHDPITNLFLMLIYADASSQAGLGERSQAKKKWCYSFWPLHPEYITNLAWLISMSYGTSTTTLDLQILWPNEIRRQECLSPSDIRYATNLGQPNLLLLPKVSAQRWPNEFDLALHVFPNDKAAFPGIPTSSPRAPGSTEVEIDFAGATKWWISFTGRDLWTTCVNVQER